MDMVESDIEGMALDLFASLGYIVILCRKISPS
jgi:hypothetical protein